MKVVDTRQVLVMTTKFVLVVVSPDRIVLLKASEGADSDESCLVFRRRSKSSEDTRKLPHHPKSYCSKLVDRIASENS